MLELEENKSNSSTLNTLYDEDKDLIVNTKDRVANYFNSQIIDFRKEFNRKLVISKKSFNDLNKEIKEIKSEKIKTIEALGLFVAIFTFISIDFQVFRSYRDPKAISGLVLISLGAIGLLMSMFDFFIFAKKFDEKIFDNGKLNLNTRFWRVFFVIIEVTFIFSGVYLFQNSDPELFQEEIQKIEEKMTQDIEINISNNFGLENLKKENEINKSILLCLKHKGQYSNDCFNQ